MFHDEMEGLMVKISESNLHPSIISYRVFIVSSVPRLARNVTTSSGATSGGQRVEAGDQILSFLMQKV